MFPSHKNLIVMTISDIGQILRCCLMYYFDSDHDVNMLMPFKIFIIRTLQRPGWPLCLPLIPDNVRLIWHYPLHKLAQAFFLHYNL